jgi:DinB superfamily
VNQTAAGYHLFASRLFFMNTECNRIAYQLASTLNGEAWYGDSLREILNGITAEQARAHPIPNAHSIWELVLHVEAWCKLAIGAVQGTPIPPWASMPKELDWPPVAGTSEQAWQGAVTSLFSAHLRFVDAIKEFGDERLEATVPGRTYDFYRLFQSMTQHAVYHAGQISLLKKMAA